MSMYKIYIDDLLLPMGTDKLETTVNDRDDEMELINGEVISIIKSPGLTTWKFTTLVAPYKITGALYGDDENYRLVLTDDVISKLESLKLSKKPFQFVVVRSGNLGKTSTTVTLQDFKRTESVDNATLSEIEIKLREYRQHENTNVSITLPAKPTLEDELLLKYEDEIKRLEDLDPPETYTVKAWFKIMNPNLIGPFPSGYFYVENYLQSWFDIGKELFGDEKYGYGIRNTNNLYWNTGEDEDYPTSKFPGQEYPAPRAKLIIDVPHIVIQTNLVMESPENMR